MWCHLHGLEHKQVIPQRHIVLYEVAVQNSVGACSIRIICCWQQCADPLHQVYAHAVHSFIHSQNTCVLVGPEEHATLSS